MGIRGLTTLINKYTPEAITHHYLNYFNGSTVAIDTSILLYKFRYSNSNPNSHISGFLNKCLNYIKHGITPIFIMDGKPPPEKNDTIIKRFYRKRKIEDKIKLLQESILGQTDDNKEIILSKIEKLNKQNINVVKEHHEECKKLLEILGFEVIVSVGEAEIVCAELQKYNYVDFTYSDDTDVLPLGCKKVLRSINGKNSFMEYDLEKILIGLDITFVQFIDVCILSGCDYCQSIPRLNSEKAYLLIKRFNNIETTLKEINGEYYIPESFDFQSARKLFNYSNQMFIDNNIEETNIDNNIETNIDNNIEETNIETNIDNNIEETNIETNIEKIIKRNIQAIMINEKELYSLLTKKNFNTFYIKNYINKFKTALSLNSRSNNTETSKYFQTKECVK
jgi:flap endonuclease-1